MSMTNNLKIAPQVPSEFTPAIPMTSSDFVVSRRMREYVSDGQTDYTYEGTNIIKFTLNSADSFLDGRNSWLQFKLWGEITANGNSVATEQTARFLETGGAHALFSRLRISLSNGTIISDYDYSALYAAIRQHTMSAPHLEFQEGASSLDGITGDVFNYCGVVKDKRILRNFGDFANVGAWDTINNVAAADDVSQTVVITGMAGASVNYAIGEEVVLMLDNDTNNLQPLICGKVINIPTANSMTIETGTTIDNVGDNNLAGVLKVSRGDRSIRFRGAQGTAAAPVVCKVKLFSDFFNNIKYLPLPFLRNLTIELTLNRPHHSVVFARKGNADGIGDAFAFKWHIQDPVIVANLITPSESLMNAYVEQYNSEQGIMLHWIDYVSNKISRNNRAQNDTFTIPSNCHSALAILVLQKLAESQSATADSYANDTNGTHIKGLITSYQFQCGSEYFPFARPVDCGNGATGTPAYITNGNNWNYVLQALDSHGAKYECSSILPEEYFSVNKLYRPKAFAASGVSLDNESLKFVMAARLDRDGNYTGIDTSNNDLQLNITRSGALGGVYDGYYYHSFIIHNRLMRISKASTIVFS